MVVLRCVFYTADRLIEQREIDEEPLLERNVKEYKKGLLHLEMIKMFWYKKYCSMSADYLVHCTCSIRSQLIASDR